MALIMTMDFFTHQTHPSFSPLFVRTDLRRVMCYDSLIKMDYSILMGKYMRTSINQCKPLGTNCCHAGEYKLRQRLGVEVKNFIIYN